MGECRVIWQEGALRVERTRPGGGAPPGLRTGELLRILDQEGSRPVPVSEAGPLSDQGVWLAGAAAGFTARAEWKRRQGRGCPYLDVTLQVVYQGPEPVDAGVQVAFELAGPGRPSWLIPAVFYGENRLPHCSRIYPRYQFDGDDPRRLVSDSWSFRADRAAVPAVFAWNDQCCAALATSERSLLGLSGMGFRGNARETSLWLNFPYREEPVTYTGPGEASPPDWPLHRWSPGEAVTLTFRAFVGSPDPHGYAPFLRELYALDQPANPLRPWMGLGQAAALTAYGLYRWHYDPERQILRETAAFDRELNAGLKGDGDRPNMHVAWVSGAPYAHALLAYGRSQGIPEYVAAGEQVLEKIASGLAPCGAFWGEWREGRGWSQGWSPGRHWLHTRTLADATLFMIRAIRSEQQHGVDHPGWRQAVRSNLSFIAGRQREDGNLGTYYDAESGQVMEWDGAGGILWIAALLEGAALLGKEELLQAALRAGSYYRRFVEEAFIYGAPEDVHLTPTSEDGYNAVIAYVLLYEAEGRADWLELARLAAEWTMTFRWTYNLAFPEQTILRQYDFRSRGADLASPSNQHLHNYGLVCLPEMLRLWRHTGDRYFLDRTRDNLACFLQFIARGEGDFNARKGMVTERYYNTNCFQPKGMLLTLSHAWSVGMILYAAQASLEFEEELNLDRILREQVTPPAGSPPGPIPPG